MSYAFIDAQKATYAVEPICRVLQVAPSGYHTPCRRLEQPARRSARAQQDDVLRAEIRRVWQTNRCVYGVRRVWRQLGREDTAVARCTIERLMRAEGLRGVVRGRRIRTMLPDLVAERPRDLVRRAFRLEQPNQLWVADFTWAAT